LRCHMQRKFAPCNHSVCHKESEAVDSRQLKVDSSEEKDLTQRSLRSDTEGAEKKCVKSARMRS
jgi:hypothetical protein